MWIVQRYSNICTAPQCHLLYGKACIFSLFNNLCQYLILTVSRMICGTFYKFLINILGVTCRFFLFLPLQDIFRPARLIQLPHVLIGINKTYIVHMLWPIYAYLCLFRVISAHIRIFIGHISSVPQFCIRHIWLLFNPINLNYQLLILQYFCAGFHPFMMRSTLNCLEIVF